MRGAVLILTALVCLACAGAARAGVDLRDVPRAGATGSDTATLAAAGGVNGDGVQDVAVELEADVRTPGPGLPPEIGGVGFGPAAPDPTAAGFAGLVARHIWTSRRCRTIAAASASGRPSAGTSPATVGRTWRSRSRGGAR